MKECLHSRSKCVCEIPVCRIKEQKRWKHFVLGYEDCPVGTDNSIYGIAKIDSKWVIVFNSDLGQKDENGYQAIYYEISPECGKIFEKSNIWKY